MKKELVIIAIFSLSLTQLSAQDNNKFTGQLPTVTVTSSVNVNSQVSKAFEKAFANAQNLKWYKQNKDYLANFILDQVEHDASFKKNGYLKYDVSYGYEKFLPADIQQEVKARYSNFAIARVFNVKAENRDIWLINLDGPKNSIVVRSEGGEIEELDTVRKGK